MLLAPFDAEAWSGRVVSVADGDTITVEPEAGGERIKVRLHGIDCPERRQPYGEAARGFVYDLALYKTVEVEETDRDRYGRTVAIVHLENDTLQAALLRAGMAWVYIKYCPNCSEWDMLQEDARRSKRGLWADEASIPHGNGGRSQNEVGNLT